MKVVKRNGELQDVKFDKITERIRSLSKDLNICPVTIAKDVCNRIHDGVHTKELDKFTSNIAMSMSLSNPDYLELSSRICVSNIHKETSNNLLEVVESLYNNVDQQGNHTPLINDNYYNTVKKYNKQLENMIDYDRDYNLDYFGVMTLKRAYLLKCRNKSNLKESIAERPQHLWMRVAVCIHSDNLKLIKETYDLLSNKYFTHATPTLFNAGTCNQQMSSCFLLMNDSDSVRGIYKTIADCAQISKYAGGIGLALHNVRCNDAYIRGTNGYSSGILPLMRVLNSTARYINQAGKRLGSFAIYIEPWHADIFDFLEARRNQGSEHERARDLFYGLWIPDLFMKRVENDERWTLFCPDTCPKLYQTYGEEFENLYTMYEYENKGKKTVKAREIWNEIINSQIETGMPYMLYKDAVNKKTNQKNIGIIKSSNLCCEIVQHTSSKETAVCNLSSISLPKFVKIVRHPYKSIIIYGIKNCVYCNLTKSLLTDLKYTFEYVDCTNDSNLLKRVKMFPKVMWDKKEVIGGYTGLLNKIRPVVDHISLYNVTRVVTRNLNKVIDKNYYPIPEAKHSNLKHRPIGIGVQGLADLLILLKYPYDGKEARQINKEIFETMYYAALTESCKIAQNNGIYKTFPGSPLSKGLFQFDLWNNNKENKFKPSDRWNWESLRVQIKSYGVANSLLLAPMPTASTSQIMGNTESFEPYTSNMFVRRTLAGEFVVINKHLIKHLIQLGIWNEQLKQKILFYNGSVQKIPEIPKWSRELFKTSWEIKQKVVLDMAIDRGHFICQSQSLNIYAENPTYSILTKIHFYGWKGGLKTGSYYIRSRPASSFQKFTIDPNLEKKFRNEQLKILQESKECLTCSS